MIPGGCLLLLILAHEFPKNELAAQCTIMHICIYTLTSYTLTSCNMTLHTDTLLNDAPHTNTLHTTSAGRSDMAGGYSSDVQAVMDVVWAMAVLRPRLKVAKFVLRSLPRWKSFRAHRKMAQRLMPHWFPL